MNPSDAQQKLAPAFQPGEHRRRPSMPSTPPETPMDGFFGPVALKAPPAAVAGLAIYPASPPVTPERAQREKEEQRVSEKERPRSFKKRPSSRRPPSEAYAHHRRTSTATIIRLALAQRGVSPILTPSKALSLFLIVLSATYLASFLPVPSILLFRRASPPVAHAPHWQKPPAYALPSMPTYARNNVPHAVHHPHRQAAAPVLPIGDVAQRKAWESALSYRIPPQQSVVPSTASDEEEGVAGDEAPPHHRESQDGELWRLHPELLKTGLRPARRRPLRLEKQEPVTEQERDEGAGVEEAPSDSGKSAPRVHPDDEDDTPRARVVAASDGKERQAQMLRMQKVALAKQQPARVGSYVPVDSSAQADAARAEQDRVIVPGGQAQGRRRLRNPSKLVVELEQELKAEHELESEQLRGWARKARGE
ncbi:hypothetical protein Rhopal_004814-T1 [Rhodotorula paludigena]|uniref:Uncharacterized protein n=1 Tax=Rhodotorula paludigena TaxID=86838 RepID=A0AAV5GGU9_9BASI|nr:hypothetical protein Rhopal_004814-T1 [Rhodotorula paludigena]